jgi:short-subunit dehydrogenase
MEVGPQTRVIVTGASRGIGRAIAQAFAAEGCTVGLVARTEESLTELASSLPGEGHIALAADVADPASIAAAVERFGQVDVLVANAGLAHYRRFTEQPIEEIEQMTAVNWMGCVYTVRAALPGMLERGRGHVVITSSGAGYRAFPWAAVYGSTKGAQRLFGEALWHELDGTGVGVTVVYPGEVKSDLHAHEIERMPPWRKNDEEAPAEPLARDIVAAVRSDKRAVNYPGIVRILRIAHGISPSFSDLFLRLLRGASAAPRKR